MPNKNMDNQCVVCGKVCTDDDVYQIRILGISLFVLCTEHKKEFENEIKKVKEKVK